MNTTTPRHRAISPRVALVTVLVGLMAVPSPSLAYTREAHYYLRFGLALATCFDYEEAHLIASGDWMMDGNLSTHAEMTPFKKKNKIRFHAFGHSDARFNELWDRTRAEPDLELRLIKLGQFMHFLEDWESHAGFGTALGHAKATFGGRDPDSLGSNPDKNIRMAQSALEHLLRTCADIGRTGDPSMPDDPDYYLVWLMRLIIHDGIMDDLFEIGDPTWKKGKFDGIRKSHQEVRDRSRLRVEEFVDALKAYPDKKIPEWFTPGDPERGIPLVLQIPYDENGNLLARPGAPDPVDEVLARNLADRENEDLRVYIDSYKQFQGGFSIHLTAENVGSEASDVGSVDVYVIDPDQQQELGRASVDLEALAAGETAKKHLTVHARTTTGQQVMIGAIARVADFSALDNENWLMSEEEANEPAEVPLVVDVDPDMPGQETLLLAQGPKVWFVDEEAICVTVTASTSEGDATEKLIEVGLEVVTEDGALIADAREFPARWGASAQEGSPLIAAKTFACFKPLEAECLALAEHRSSSIRALISLKAPGLEPVERDYPMPTDVLAGAQRLCEVRTE